MKQKELTQVLNHKQERIMELLRRIEHIRRKITEAAGIIALCNGIVEHEELNDALQSLRDAMEGT